MRLGDGRCGETGGGKESGEGREFTWIKKGRKEEGRKGNARGRRRGGRKESVGSKAAREECEKDERDRRRVRDEE